MVDCGCDLLATVVDGVDSRHVDMVQRRARRTAGYGNAIGTARERLFRQADDRRNQQNPGC
jgi:hypothetical protein